MRRSLSRLDVLILLLLIPACAPSPPVPRARSVPPLPTYRAKVKALVGGTVVHTHGARAVIRDATVLVDGERIVAVGPSAQVTVPPGADRIDVRGRWIIPGLVDGHIHFFQSGGLYTRPDGLDLRHRVSYAAEQAWIQANLDDLFRRYLRSGVTTVADAGGPMWNLAARDRARRSPAAPRVFVAGPLIASYTPPALASPDPAIIQVTTVEEAVALVRRQAVAGVDFIKVWFVVGKDAALPPDRFQPLAEAVVAEARRHRLRVWFHAPELDTAKRSLRAGADVLVHSVVDRPVDPELLALARQRGVVYQPTPWVFSSYAAVYTRQLRLLPVEHWLGNPHVIGTLFDMARLAPSELGERQRRLLAARAPIAPSPVLLENLRRVHRAGITVATGTDAGNVGVLHGPAIFHDLALMAQAGMPAHDLLVAATLNGARLLGRERDQGSLEPGKVADLVVLGADPLADILSTADVRLVMKAGAVHWPETLVPRTPEALAQIQLNAYNARDLETFVSVYHPDVEVYDFPRTLTLRGRAAMRAGYRRFFEKATNLHAQVTRRIVQGRFVIDQEDVITGIPGRERLAATAMYEVEDGLIRRVWFLR
jgi:imidazolonepropionase-like amidohydrolase